MNLKNRKIKNIEINKNSLLCVWAYIYDLMSESSSKPKYPKAPHKHIHKKMRKTLFVAPTSVLVSRLRYHVSVQTFFPFSCFVSNSQSPFSFTVFSICVQPHPSSNLTRFLGPVWRWSVTLMLLPFSSTCMLRGLLELLNQVLVFSRSWSAVPATWVIWNLPFLCDKGLCLNGENCMVVR